MRLECHKEMLVSLNKQKRNCQVEIDQNLNSLLSNHPTFKKKENNAFYIPTSILQPSANLNTSMYGEFSFCKDC